MTNAVEIVTPRVHEGDIIIKNGRTIRLVTKFAHELSDHVMSIGWPTMSLHGNLSDPKGTTSSDPSGASYKAHGGYIGSNSEGYIDINKQVNCRNLTSDVMDFAIAITYALQSHLHNTDFIWDSVFVGLDVDEKYLRKLPSKGYALMLLLGEFSGITFSTGNCGSSISLPGDMLMFRPSEVKCKNLGSGGCFAIVLYESGTRDDHRTIDTLRQKSLGERWRENADLEEIMTTDCGPYDPNDPGIFKGPIHHLQAKKALKALRLMSLGSLFWRTLTTKAYLASRMVLMVVITLCRLVVKRVITCIRSLG
jgi:hypothetical protein